MQIYNEILESDFYHSVIEDTSQYRSDRIIEDPENIDSDRLEDYYLIHDFLSYGDYDNSCHVERANVDKFLELFKDVKGVKVWKGGYNTVRIAINLTVDNQEIIEILNGLEDYPAISDEAVSFKEREMINEAWESYGREDIKDSYFETFEKELTDSQADNLKHEAETLGIEYAIIESGGIVCFFEDKIIPENPIN